MEDLERFPVKSERTGNLGTDEGGKDARHESRVISDTDADDLDSEHGGSQRRPEDRPETATHAAHDHDFFVPLIHMEEIPEIISDAAADL